MWKIPIIANNSRNIKKIKCKNDGYNYYYVNVDSELIVFNALVAPDQYKILDNDVDFILHQRYYDCHIVYTKNNTIICSDINNFPQLTGSYIINNVNKFIIKSSDDFLLDSDGDLYQLIRNNKKFITKKISDSVVNFYCSSYYVYISDASYQMYRINRYDHAIKYIDDGHFGKKFSNTKSANNTL